MALRKAAQIAGNYLLEGVGVLGCLNLASITGFYVAIKNDVDVVRMLGNVGYFHIPIPEGLRVGEKKKINLTTEILNVTGGAFELARECNHDVFPVLLGISLALTPLKVRRMTMIKK